MRLLFQNKGEWGMKYADSVDIKDKKEIWNLYFYKGYNYEKLQAHFNNKYRYSQLKSIILERLSNGNSAKTFK